MGNIKIHKSMGHKSFCGPQRHLGERFLSDFPVCERATHSETYILFSFTLVCSSIFHSLQMKLQFFFFDVRMTGRSVFLERGESDPNTPAASETITREHPRFCPQHNAGCVPVTALTSLRRRLWLLCCWARRRQRWNWAHSDTVRTRDCSVQLATVYAPVIEPRKKSNWERAFFVLESLHMQNNLFQPVQPFFNAQTEYAHENKDEEKAWNAIAS